MVTKVALFVTIACLATFHINHVHGQSRSRSEVFGDVVEYFETLTGGVFKVQTSWPGQLREDLEGIATQLKAWKDTRDETVPAMQQPSFLMHR
ncbi:hypothetical protein quinque_000311 [Culex quinquefasciatus]